MKFGTDTLNAMARLRPPFARSATLLYPWSVSDRTNSGITVGLPADEPVIVPGSGVVLRIWQELPHFYTQDSYLLGGPAYHVAIDHGHGLTTILGGLATVSVNSGASVERGDLVGTLRTTELFFGVRVAGKAFNPLSINAHFQLQDGNAVVGQTNKIRFAPDRIVRDLTNGITTFLAAGIRYFTPPEKLLVNIAFNGDGTKSGEAAIGIGEDDYWNIYEPLTFTSSSSYFCGPEAFTYSAAPFLSLNDYTSDLSPLVLERVPPLPNAAGSVFHWDAMLARYIGGYLLTVPYENTFRLRGMAAGVYDLYLYANAGTTNISTFYVSVNQGSPSALSNDPMTVDVEQFIEGRNYVKFTVTVPARGYVTVKSVGYLSGLQFQRQ